MGIQLETQSEMGGMDDELVEVHSGIRLEKINALR